MLRTTVQNSKTFLRPQLQLFAEPAPQVNPDKNPNNQIPPPADPPGGGTEPNLPKTHASKTRRKGLAQKAEAGPAATRCPSVSFSRRGRG